MASVFELDYLSSVCFFLILISIVVTDPITSSSSPDVAIPEEGHRSDPARGKDAQGCKVALGLVQVILICQCCTCYASLGRLVHVHLYVLTERSTSTSASSSSPTGSTTRGRRRSTPSTASTKCRATGTSAGVLFAQLPYITYVRTKSFSHVPHFVLLPPPAFWAPTSLPLPVRTRTSYMNGPT